MKMIFISASNSFNRFAHHQYRTSNGNVCSLFSLRLNEFIYMYNVCVVAKTTTTIDKLFACIQKNTNYKVLVAPLIRLIDLFTGIWFNRLWLVKRDRPKILRALKYVMHQQSLPSPIWRPSPHMRIAFRCSWCRRRWMQSNVAHFLRSFVLYLCANDRNERCEHNNWIWLDFSSFWKYYLKKNRRKCWYFLYLVGAWYVEFCARPAKNGKWRLSNRSSMQSSRMSFSTG